MNGLALALPWVLLLAVFAVGACIARTSGEGGES